MIRSGYPEIVLARTALETQSALGIAFPSLDSVSFGTICKEALLRFESAIACVFDSREGELWATEEAGKGDAAFAALLDHAGTYSQPWVILKPTTGQYGTSLVWEVHATCSGGFPAQSVVTAAVDPMNKRSLWGMMGYIAGKLGPTDSICFAFSQQSGDAYAQLLICYTVDSFASLAIRGADDVTIKLNPFRAFANQLPFEGGAT